jgi:hypothetical protein
VLSASDRRSPWKSLLALRAIVPSDFLVPQVIDAGRRDPAFLRIVVGTAATRGAFCAQYGVGVDREPALALGRKKLAATDASHDFAFFTPVHLPIPSSWLTRGSVLSERGS